MRPSDRIKLITVLSRRLSELEWKELDLTLRQFGLPWSEGWSSDKLSYCIHHIEGGNDDALLGLYEHLYDGKSYGVGFADTSGPWQGSFFRLFLSHVSIDKSLVTEVKTALFPMGIHAFVAHEDIEPTKEWEREIEIALDTCDALVAFLSSEFHQSLWTDQEIGFCVKRRILIIPIRMGLDPYGFLARYQALLYRGAPPEVIAGELFDILSTHDLTATKMASAIVKRFEESISFADAKRNVEYLDRIKIWSSELLRRIEQAVEDNSQLADAWGVPVRVREIVNRHRQ